MSRPNPRRKRHELVIVVSTDEPTTPAEAAHAVSDGLKGYETCGYVATIESWKPTREIGFKIRAIKRII